MGLFKTTGVAKLKIFVDSADGQNSFRRGDLVKGNVYLQLATSIKYKVISINLVGQQYFSGTDPPVVSKVVDYVSYVKTAPVAVGEPAPNRGGGSNSSSSGARSSPGIIRESNGSLNYPIGSLPEGEYHFPFAIPIPSDALPSAGSTFSSYSVAYTLRATVVREGGAMNNTEQQEITVLSSISKQQYDTESSTPLSYSCTVPMKNSLLSTYGCVEVVANLSGTTLVVSRATNRLRLSVEVRADGGKKPVNWAKVELQQLTSVDPMRAGKLQSYQKYRRVRKGDMFYNSSKKQLVPEKEDTEYPTDDLTENIAQGTNLPGYTGDSSGKGSFDWSTVNWKCDLKGPQIPIGGKGVFSGNIMMDGTASSDGTIYPTARGENAQVNWRVAVQLDNCSRKIYMPVVVVQGVVEGGGGQSIGGSSSSLPWFHHEKCVQELHGGQTYEVPAMGSVVREDHHQGNPASGSAGFIPPPPGPASSPPSSQQGQDLHGGGNGLYQEYDTHEEFFQ